MMIVQTRSEQNSRERHAPLFAVSLTSENLNKILQNTTFNSIQESQFIRDIAVSGLLAMQ